MDQCSDSDKPQRWLTKGSCAKIIEVKPSHAEKINKLTSVIIIKVQNLPLLLTERYKCSFVGHVLNRSTPAHVDPISSDYVTGGEVDDVTDGNVTLRCDMRR
ncbi:hypothetical protein HELRODRAFT_177082 [Helobdella robusta]|uniref:Uncharacterized protein n=1 Tax=Helobdella robusta TaxID=6412 RepID=T1FB77_HELRO|nr:hypothetical protein HELRODRAFT_177082 [Helobdella robusta]ESN98215.1 hypothetical protein HELRODRAFT_177082 [Helobdella robusta]